MNTRYENFICVCNLHFLTSLDTNFGCAASLATLDKLVDRFSLPPVAPLIGDTSLTHVMRLAAPSTTSPTPTAMGQSFIMTVLSFLSKTN
jgi:hypothetical protein